MECWHGYLSGVSCRLAYCPADSSATHCLFSKIQIGFTLLVAAHPGSPGKRAVKRAHVCVGICNPLDERESYCKLLLDAMSLESYQITLLLANILWLVICNVMLKF